MADELSKAQVLQRMGWALESVDDIHRRADKIKEHVLLAQGGVEAMPELPDLPDPDPPEEPPIEEPDPDPENETPEIPGPETPGLIVGEDFSSYEDNDPLNGLVGPPDSVFRWKGQTNNTRVSTRYALSGDRSLLFDYPATPHNVDSIREQRFWITPDAASAPSEVGIEYMVRVPDNWAFRTSTKGAGNNKLLAIFGESYSDGPYTEPRFVFEWGWGGAGDGDARLWMGSNERGPSGGRPEPRKGGRQNTLKAGVVFDTSMRGQWIRLRYHLKIAMAGVLDVWRDDELVSRAPADWRTLPWHGPINYFRGGYLMGWSNAGFDEATDFAIDNLIIHRGTPPWLGEMAG